MFSKKPMLGIGKCFAMQGGNQVGFRLLILMIVAPLLLDLTPCAVAIAGIGLHA
jgi:hypothetical protein